MIPPLRYVHSWSRNGACSDIGSMLMTFCLFFAVVGFMTTGVRAGLFGRHLSLHG